jgi:hypothetical protein
MMHLALVLLAAGVAPPVPAESGAQRENLANWPTRFPLAPADAKAGTLVGVTLLPEVFGRSTPGQGDLRLADAGGEPIPYALRVRTPRDVPEVRAGKPINAGTRPDGTLECSIDLGENPGEHNEVFIPVPGRSYHRAVRVEGGDDNKTWNVLLKDGLLTNLSSGRQVIDQRRFSYPPSRYRYLRVQVGKDTVPEPNEVKLESFQVLRNVRLPGVTDAYDGQVTRSDPGRFQNAYATATVIDLGAERVPVSGLLIDVEQGEFARPYFLEAENEAGWYMVTQGELRPNLTGGPIAVRFPETPARRLRLQVIDASNTPLTIRAARFEVVRREVLFRVPAEAKTPLYLYAGNPQAQPPAYDFATQLPAEAKAEAGGSVSAGEANPAYVPPPVAWSERHPRLIDGVLGFAGVVLAAILAALARAAIRRRDAVVPAP